MRTPKLWFFDQELTELHVELRAPTGGLRGAECTCVESVGTGTTKRSRAACMFYIKKTIHRIMCLHV